MRGNPHFMNKMSFNEPWKIRTRQNLVYFSIKPLTPRDTHASNRITINNSWNFFTLGPQLNLKLDLSCSWWVVDVRENGLLWCLLCFFGHTSSSLFRQSSKLRLILGVTFSLIIEYKLFLCTIIKQVFAWTQPTACWYLSWTACLIPKL